MVEHEHGNENDVNAVAVKKDSITMSSLVTYTSSNFMHFVESWESGGIVIVYTFLYVAIPSHNNLPHGYSAMPPSFNRYPAFNTLYTVHTPGVY